MFGVLVSVVDYEAVVDKIITAAREKRPLAVSAMAVHGLSTCATDPVHRHRLNRFDVVTPDGQPVRWALNLLHGAGLRQRVYGNQLTLETYAAAAKEGTPIYLYGSRQEVIDALLVELPRRFPGLKIVGSRPRSSAGSLRRSGRSDRGDQGFRCRNPARRHGWRASGDLHLRERQGDADADARHRLSLRASRRVPAEPPMWVQRMGVHWIYRLLREPRRLWKRYLVTNSIYLGLLLFQWSGLYRRSGEATMEPTKRENFG